MKANNGIMTDEPWRSKLNARCEAISAAVSATTLEALLVTNPASIFYLTNFRDSSGAAIVGPKVRALIVDFRYLTVASELANSQQVPRNLQVVSVARSYDEKIAEVLKDLGLTRVGVESQHLTLGRWRWLRERLEASTVELVPTDGLVEKERKVKDPLEVELLRTAGTLITRAVPEIFDLVRAGRSERGIAADIDRVLFEAGFEGPAFDTIVASGPNSAFPHARPDLRELDRGDLVLLDFRGIYGGYCVDLTRTVCVKEIDDHGRALHETASHAHGAAVAAVTPGKRASEVDAVAREILKRCGLAAAFGHSTGHEIGIEVHERPRVTQRRDDEEGGDDAMLQSGMIFAIEPGVYVPGYGGVKIEDDVLVTDSGCEVLTNASRDLAVR